MACPERHLLITCEHGGNRVPPAYAELFREAGVVLRSHRGYDPGSLQLGRRLAKHFAAPWINSTVTRLLVELNRSLGHSELFSEFTRELPRPVKHEILARYYHPYRQRVEEAVENSLARGEALLHVSVHTFSPALNGQRRTAEIGLLYDPTRATEKLLCRQWCGDLRSRLPGFRVRRNYPYLGKADGLTTHLRRRFAQPHYAGIELEVNQALYQSSPAEWRKVGSSIAESLAEVRRDFDLS